MVVKHDMSKNEREEAKTFRKEARQRSIYIFEDSDWCTNADVLTKDKLIELNHRIKMAKHKPNIISISLIVILMHSGAF